MLLHRILSYVTVAILAVPTAVVSPEHSLVPIMATENPASSLFERMPLEPQSLIVSSNVKPVTLERGSYSATTKEEVEAIQKARADKEAAEAAEAARVAAEAERQRLAEQAKNRPASSGNWVAISQQNPQCNSNYCWPLNSFTYEPSNNGFQTAQRPNHNGFDMLAPAETPIYAVTGGTVVVSSEAHYGFGVAVAVESIVDGQRVVMTYGHMTYGTRQVKVGDTVVPGQVLGGVGSTGNSTANHLHLEIRVNNMLVDPQAWLTRYAG